tara:strand:- start:260 stop:1612 length:1353 start_codon:yes stop_codon:yes gene_type:complete
MVMQQNSLLYFQPSDALPPPRYTGILLPIERDKYGFKGNFELSPNQLMKNAYSGIMKFGKLGKGELSLDEIKQLAFDTSLNVAGGGFLGSQIPRAMPKGALGMSGSKPLTKEQIDPFGYGKTKGLLTKPLDEFKIGLTKSEDLIPQKNLTIEDLQGTMIFPLLGDQSATGLLMKSIDDLKFQKPVKLGGGFNFMRSEAQKKEGTAWASGKGVISDIHNRVKKIAEKSGLPVRMVYTAMGKDAVDFATFPASVLAEQIPFKKILKKDAQTFNKKMKEKLNIKGDMHNAIDDFIGIESPLLRAYLDVAPPSTRKKFVKLMDTAEFQNADFPSVALTRFAVTDEALKKALTGDSGLAIASPNLTKAPTDNPLVPHSTYPTQMYGDYLGGFSQSVPKTILYRDFFNKFKNAKTSTGKPLTPSMIDYIFRLNLPAQKVDQELVDTVSKYMEKKAN